MLSLIVNPSAGGGRATAAVPAVITALDAHGLGHKVTFTESLEHARQLGREAAAAGAVAVAFGGDGTVAAVAGALRDREGVLGVLPGVAATTSPGRSGSRRTPWRHVQCW